MGIEIEWVNQQQWFIINLLIVINIIVIINGPQQIVINH